MQDTYMRGQIYYVASDPSSVPIGAEIWSDRPGLIVSNDTTNKTSGAVEIVYLTTSLHRRPSPLLIKVTSGDRSAMANCSQVHSVDKSRLRQVIGTVTDKELAASTRHCASRLASTSRTTEAPSRNGKTTFVSTILKPSKKSNV